MAAYRLIIHHEGRLLGHFEAAGPDSLADVDLLAGSLRNESGYALELLAAHGERRILEATPDSIRVLSAEPLYVPAKAWKARHTPI